MHRARQRDPLTGTLLVDKTFLLHDICKITARPKILLDADTDEVTSVVNMSQARRLMLRRMPHVDQSVKQLSAIRDTVMTLDGERLHTLLIMYLDMVAKAVHPDGLSYIEQEALRDFTISYIPVIFGHGSDFEHHLPWLREYYHVDIFRRWTAWLAGRRLGKTRSLAIMYAALLLTFPRMTRSPEPHFIGTLGLSVYTNADVGFGDTEETAISLRKEIYAALLATKQAYPGLPFTIGKLARTIYVVRTPCGLGDDGDIRDMQFRTAKIRRNGVYQHRLSCKGLHAQIRLGQGTLQV